MRASSHCQASIFDQSPNHTLLPMRVGAGSEIVSRGSRMAELFVKPLTIGRFFLSVCVSPVREPLGLPDGC